MLIANGFEEIYNNLDFTDSIIECIAWENNLLDLVLTIDYYNSNEEELLKLRFKDCLKADFSLTTNLLSVPEEEKRSYSMSWYTIQNYKLLRDSELLKQYNQKELFHLQIFTTDQVIPWLSVVSKEIQVERVMNI
ncbi:hypothetical protein [Bacillus pseudomycoides]|uniref:hypothetical protein n=1 Tax=Bacillus pseudomycoides TaxID=64104 RepID=UPI001155C51C|nr:hypothetical protein [Bacillus pseudomycoides]